MRALCDPGPLSAHLRLPESLGDRGHHKGLPISLRARTDPAPDRGRSGGTALRRGQRALYPKAVQRYVPPALADRGQGSAEIGFCFESQNLPRESCCKGRTEQVRQKGTHGIGLLWKQSQTDSVLLLLLSLLYRRFFLWLTFS